MLSAFSLYPPPAIRPRRSFHIIYTNTINIHSMNGDEKYEWNIHLLRFLHIVVYIVRLYVYNMLSGSGTVLHIYVYIIYLGIICVRIEYAVYTRKSIIHRIGYVLDGEIRQRADSRTCEIVNIKDNNKPQFHRT